MDISGGALAILGKKWSNLISLQENIHFHKKDPLCNTHLISRVCNQSWKQIELCIVYGIKYEVGYEYGFKNDKNWAVYRIRDRKWEKNEATFKTVPTWISLLIRFIIVHRFDHFLGKYYISGGALAILGKKWSNFKKFPRIDITPPFAA